MTNCLPIWDMYMKIWLRKCFGLQATNCFTILFLKMILILMKLTFFWQEAINCALLK